MRKHIVLVTGGTAGHVFPAIALAEKLKNQATFHMIVDERGSHFLKSYENLFETIHYLSIKRPRQKIQYIISFLKATLKSLFVLRSIQPDIVVGFGGYFSVPTVWCAQILRIKTAIHEQNALLGKANRFLSKKATVVGVSFKNTLKAPPNAIWCGNFLLKNRQNVRFSAEPFYPKEIQGSHEAQKRSVHMVHEDSSIEETTEISSENELCRKSIGDFETNIVSDNLRVLITGGSLGAHFLTEFMADIVPHLNKNTIEIYHQCPSSDVDNLKNIYKQYDINATVTHFIDHMGKAFLWSDFVICRAGATTISELLFFKKPSLLIPLPSSAEGDQSYNANYLQSIGVAMIRHQADLSIDDVLDFFKPPYRSIQKMKVSFDVYTPPDASIFFQKLLG
jgi:UDP-N-acetylglucosamine--N-acetylmuramyl-(pentapeptide) pyrophosphoryl-undecaprenol N-acetylglucosamine transferase